MRFVHRVQAVFPWLPAHDVVNRLYPYDSLLLAEGRRAVEDIYASFKVRPEDVPLARVRMAPGEGKAMLTVDCGGSAATSVEVRNIVGCFHKYGQL